MKEIDKIAYYKIGITEEQLKKAEESLQIESTININSVQRERIREEISLRLSLAGSYDKELSGNLGYVKNEKRLDIVIGLPAAGKSSAVVEPLSFEHKSVIIDSDMAKLQLPEYDDGYGASAVHEESKLIFEKAFLQAIKKEKNIVCPIVGKSEESIQKLLDIAKENGYNCHLHINEISIESAVERAIKRFKTDNRFVDPYYIRSVGYKPSINYEKFKENLLFDSYHKVNNDVEKFQPPIEIEYITKDKLLEEKKFEQRQEEYLKQNPDASFEETMSYVFNDNSNLDSKNIFDKDELITILKDIKWISGIEPLSKKQENAYNFALDNFKDDKNILKELVRINPKILIRVSPNMKDDKDIVLSAIKSDPRVLKYASDRLKRNEEVILNAIKIDPLTLYYASGTLKEKFENISNEKINELLNTINAENDKLQKVEYNKKEPAINQDHHKNSNFKEEIDNIKKLSIVDFCDKNGIELKKSGRYYSLKEHDSLVIDINNNKFVWNSRGLNGDIINFVQAYYDVDFKKALNIITNKDISEISKTQNQNTLNKVEKTTDQLKESFDKDLVKNTNYSRVYAYLIKTRNIDYDIVNEFVKQDLIIEDVKHNLTFKMKDKDNNLIGLTKRETGYKKFEYINPDSDIKGVSFKTSDTPNKLYFFEAPIDLMSFYEMNKNRLNNSVLISMQGLKHNCIKENIAHWNIKDICLCVDNDEAGNNFINRIKEVYSDINMKFEIPKSKDWNEDIKNLKEKDLINKEYKNLRVVKPSDNRYVVTDKRGVKIKEFNNIYETKKFIKDNTNEEDKNKNINDRQQKNKGQER